MVLIVALTAAAPVITLPLAGEVKHNVTEYVPDGGVLVAQRLTDGVAVAVGVKTVVAVGVKADDVGVAVAVGLGVLVGFWGGFAFELKPNAG